MHLVILKDFLAKKYKTEYRTSTNRTESVGELPGTTPLTSRRQLTPVFDKPAFSRFSKTLNH